jgi:hypothetical protein
MCVMNTPDNHSPSSAIYSDVVSGKDEEEVKQNWEN